MSDTTTTASEPLSSPESVQLNIDTSEPVNSIVDEAPQCTPVSNWKPMNGSDNDANKCKGMMDMIGISLPQHSPNINVVERKPMSSAWVKVTAENGGIGAAMMHAMSGGTTSLIHANDIAPNTISITNSMTNISIDELDNSTHDNDKESTSAQTETE